MENNRAIAAIIGIVILDSIALFNGIDGVFLMTSIAIISGLGGYVLMKQGQIMLPSLTEAIKEIDRKRGQGII